MIIRVLAALWACATVSAGVLVLTTAATNVGRCFGLGAVLIGALPLCATLYYRRRWHRWMLLAGCIGCISLAGYVVERAPHTRSEHSRVEAHFWPDSVRQNQFALTNLLPEEDQLLAGFTLATAIDPLLSARQASELRRLTREVYGELDRDPDFHAMPSAMGFTYRDLLIGPSLTAHCYTYVPPTIDRNKPAALLVFFHGSGGNFKAYLWVLSKIADRARVVIAAPTGGMGGWSQSATAEAFDHAIAAASKVATIDRQRINVAGLSNGGRAVSQILATRGAQLASATFLSPVFDNTALEAAGAAEQIRGRRILIVSGVQDNRVPVTYVRENASTMTARGANVDLRTYDDATHFLVFSHREQLSSELVRWLSP